MSEPKLGGRFQRLSGRVLRRILDGVAYSNSKNMAQLEASGSETDFASYAGKSLKFGQIQISAKVKK